MDLNQKWLRESSIAINFKYIGRQLPTNKKTKRPAVERKRNNSDRGRDIPDLSSGIVLMNVRKKIRLSGFPRMVCTNDNVKR